MEPARQGGTLLQFRRMPCQFQEYALRHILGQARVAQNTQGCGVDKIDMSMHQLAEGALATFPCISANENLVRIVFHSSDNTPLNWNSDKPSERNPNSRSFDVNKRTEDKEREEVLRLDLVEGTRCFWDVLTETS